MRASSTSPPCFDACIIGGGVVGAAVCRELTLQGYACLLLEKAPHLVSGASSGNTGIACTASDVEEGTLEHQCLVEGTTLNLGVYQALNIPHRSSGTVYCAYTTDELAKLELDRKKRDTKNEAVELLSAEDVLEREPFASRSVKGGLLVQGEIVVDPWLVPMAWARHAWENGAVIRCGSEVRDATFDDLTRRWSLQIGRDTSVVEARLVVACGGLLSDQLEGLARTSPISIKPRRGDYVLFEESDVANKVGATPLGAVPNPTSRGVYVWRSVHGVVAVGPTAEEVEERAMPPVQPRKDVTRALLAAADKTYPGLGTAPVAGTYAGLRPGSDKSDYRIELVDGKPWVMVAGIRSTGLTASLGIGKHVARLCKEALHGNVPPCPADSELQWTPMPSVPDILTSFRERGDGSVVFSNTPAFGAHPVTHPLTRLGYSRMSRRQSLDKCRL